MKKTILLSFFALFSVCAQVFSMNYYIRMSTNTTDWSHITADATHVIVDYTDGDNLSLLINAYLSNDTIWIAKGTYTIDTSISLKSDQKLYGGFNGNESSLDARAKSDLDGNGDVEPWEFTNATEIVRTSTTPVANSMILASNTIVDGITMKGINNTFTTASAIINIYGAGTGSFLRNVTVKDCNVTSSTATVYIINMNAGTIQNSLIQNNSLNLTASFASFGGGLYMSGAAPRAIGCVIRGNKITNTDITKAKGGGIFVQTGGKIINCVVYNNHADGQGGGIYINDAASEIINCTVARNHSGTTGGGVYMNAGAKLNNSISWGNMSGTTTPVPNDIYFGGNGVFTTDYLAFGMKEKATTIATFPALANTKLLTSGEFADNTIDGINLDFAPKFKNPSTIVGAPADISSILQTNYKLLTGSPCIDFASNALLNTLTITTDLMNGTRFVNTTADLGAYEFGSVAPNAVKNIKNSNYTVCKNSQGLVLSGLSGENNISVFGLNGALLQSKTTIESKISLPIIQKGVYVLKVKSASTTETLKAIF